jgi:hypothetical protein
MARSRYPTLLDLIQAVSDVAASDQETLATVADLINSGQVRLCRAAAGATIDLSATAGAETWGLRPARCRGLRLQAPHRAQARGRRGRYASALRPGRKEHHATRISRICGCHLGGGHDSAAHPGHHDISPTRVNTW